MKVLHIHRFGLTGGGAGGTILMRRLHLGLRKAGIDSKILCVRKTTESAHVVVTKPSAIEGRLNRLTRGFTSNLGLEDVLNVNSRRIKKNKAYLDADIIHFHRIPNVFSYLAIPSLTQDKPAVFTLGEMWALAGHCRNSMDCERWKTGCGKCPYKHLTPTIQRDGTHLQWKLKQWAYRHSNLTCVAPSKWLTELAKQSMLNRFPIYHIPHGINAEVYRPFEPEKCRSLFNIPPGKKVLMFAAQTMERSLKGGSLLLEALQNLPESLKAETVLLVMGRKGELIADATDIQTVALGYVSDELTKAKAYSAADLFVSPTRADNFPLVLLESMACGTPLVAFGVGGVPDTVRPSITGYLAKPENAQDLCEGIVQLFEDDSLRDYMGEQCRAIAIKEYSLELMVQRYVDLYHQVLQN